jgi:hypothetical protein
MSFTGGNLYMAIFMVLMFIGVVYGYYTTRGSGISETPYGKIYSGAPAAGRKASASGHDDRVVMRDWSRGTR